MATAQDLLNEYKESHQNETNQLIHNIFVPLIYLSALGILWDVKLGVSVGFLGDLELNVAMIGTLGTFAYYLSKSFSIALGLLILSAFGLVGAYLLEQNGTVSVWLVSLIVFVLSWIAQFVGHKIEGKKPSFFKDLEFFLVGPMWVTAKLYKKLGIKY